MCRIIIVAHREQKINRFRMFGACFGIKNGNNEKTSRGVRFDIFDERGLCRKGVRLLRRERDCYRRSDEFGRVFRF